MSKKDKIFTRPVKYQNTRTRQNLKYFNSFAIKLQFKKLKINCWIELKDHSQKEIDIKELR